MSNAKTESVTPEQRKNDRRAGSDRRQVDAPPPGGVDRRKGDRRSGRERRAPR